MKTPVEILYDWTSANWDFKKHAIKEGVDKRDFNMAYYIYAFLKGNARSGMEFFPDGDKNKILKSGDGLEIAEAIYERL